MGSEGCNLKMLFFPFMAQGHMIPMVDMAKLFAARGASVTIVTTPANAGLIRPSINRANAHCHHPIQLQLIPFPSAEVGLPEGCENASSLVPELLNNFFVASAMLKEPFARVLHRLRPDCVVSDMFFGWTYDAAAELGIPRIVFHGISYFALCLTDILSRQQLVENLPADHAEPFVVPGIPHRIEMFKSQMAKFDECYQSAFLEAINQMKETDDKNFGALMNSFYELETDYSEYYRNVIGRNAWNVGPLSLCNNDVVDKTGRGFKTSINQEVCLRWLDSKSPRSVIFVCFGSMAEFSAAQLREIASGLEASSHSFIWAVRNGGEDWIPEGFEERVGERGLIIKGWAPQILILNHEAVGGFLTHCGWNSSLEGISAGLPLVTWPVFAEQFFNEKLIVDVLKIGVSVGAKEYGSNSKGKIVVEAGKVTEAVDELMGDGSEAESRRERARELGEKAKKAVEKGGSSYNDLSNLIQELMDHRRNAIDC